MAKKGGTNKTKDKRTNAAREVELSPLAESMFLADGKQPYLKDGMAIHNLEELTHNLASFEHHEALWVADWIHYLGDVETARKIRDGPAHFKTIINERWAELRKQFD